MGQISDGMSCADTSEGKITRLSLDEEIDFLEPQAERTCVPVGHESENENGPKTWVQDLPVCAKDQSVGIPKKLPERAGAVCRSAEDEARLKTALEIACRELGSRCTYEMKKAIGAK